MNTSSSLTSAAAATDPVAQDGLSDERRRVQAAVRELRTLSPLRSLLEIGSTWAWIVATLWLFALFPSYASFSAAFVMIAAKQYALLILLHDAQHSLLHPNRKVSDLLAVWFVAAPCGSTFITSRTSHLRHHQHLGDPTKDPDFFFFSSGNPAPKRSLIEFLRHFAALALGGQIIHTFFGKPDASATASETARPKVLPSFAPVVVVQALILGVTWSAGHWEVYFALWLLPLVTLTVLLNALRTFCDHANVGPDSLGGARRLVTYRSNLIERFFLAPYHMNFHAEHHLFPYVPHYNLPRLRDILSGSPVYVTEIQWRGSYLSYIAGYLRAQTTRSPDASAST